LWKDQKAYGTFRTSANSCSVTSASGASPTSLHRTRCTFKNGNTAEEFIAQKQKLNNCGDEAIEIIREWGVFRIGSRSTPKKQWWSYATLMLRKIFIDVV